MKILSTVNLGTVEATKIDAGNVSNEELQYLSNVTSDIQGQLNSKTNNSDITSTYSSTGTAPVNGKAINDAIDKLDVTEIGESGKYVSAISETNGKISATLANLPTSLPASDVSDWAKAPTKPSYTASEVGLGNVGNFKAVSTVANQNLSNTEQTNARANIGAGTSSLELGETSSTAYRGDRGKIAYDHSQTAHAPSNAEANQNAFSNVKVGSTTVSADSTTDTLTFEGTNITITPDATNDKITFSAGSAATKDVPSSGNASSSQVVMGNDTRLTDSRNAKDVYDWAKAQTKPAYTASEVGLGNVGNFLAVSTEAQTLNSTQQATARSNIGAGTSSLTLGTGSGNAYYGDKGKVAYDHSQTAHAPSNAEANQNAFSIVGVKVGNTTTNVEADSKTDTVTLIQGDNITLTADTTNDTITIKSKDTVYTHPASGVTAGTYKSVTVDANGHVTAGSNPNTLAGYGITDAATSTQGGKADTAVQSVKIGTTEYKSGTTVILPAYPTTLPASDTTSSYSSTGTAPVNGKAVKAALDTLGTAAGKNYTTNVSSGSSDLVTSGAVYTAIDNLPEPMIFKGSLGTSGTITSLPTASSSNEGYTYKVITAGTYASQSAKVGDVFISNGSSWILIPSGDEPSGTVTSVKIQASSPIAIDSSDAITSSGTRTISHANSGASAGSYGDSAAQTPSYGGTFKVPYITVNATGHVTGISEHTVKIPASDNTNTTYSFANGTNSFTVTPSNGSAQTVTVTPNDTTKLPLAGGTLTGAVEFANGSIPLSAGKVTGLRAGTSRVYSDGIAISNPATFNDVGFIRVLGTGESDTVLEIATGDDGGDPSSGGETIAVRQYNTSNQIAKEAKLLDPYGNTTFPGTVTTQSVQVGGTAATMQYNSTNKCIDFVFA